MNIRFVTRGICLLGAAFFFNALTAKAQTASSGANTDLPVVSLSADPWKTSEPCPTCRVAPAVLTVERSFASDHSLIVYLHMDGTAQPEADYTPLPSRVEIPAGETSVQVTLGARDDFLAEGPEVVRVRVSPPPPGSPVTYRIHEFLGETLLVIGDDEPDAPAARLDFVTPANGQNVPEGIVLPLSVISVWTEGEAQLSVEFYDGKTLIGKTPGLPFARPPIPCLPHVHTITWTNPPSGEHVLTARTELAPDMVVESRPVKINVQTMPMLPVVGIETVQAISEESSYPYRRLAFVGVFRVFRSGPTNESLLVFLRYSGLAKPELDYPALPWVISIPAGAHAVELRVPAIPDEMPEGIETLIAQVSNCPPETDPSLGMPCVAFNIDPAKERALIYLRDDGITEASVAITKPASGAIFKPGETIPLEAVAIDLNSYISRVEFWDGAHRLGVSEIVFVRAPDPGTPIHHYLEWKDAAAGPHEVTARAVSSAGERLASPPVHLQVGEPPRLPVVSIESVQPIAEEDCYPLERLPFAGVFRISRQEPANTSLTVFVRYGGTATPGEDYPELPWLVSIPAGETSVDLRVVPKVDDLLEGLETLIATLDNCPPPGFGMPCSGFEIDPAHVSATVFIRDDGLTKASVVMTKPRDGMVFKMSQPIGLEAVAIDLEGSISRVEFWDGEHKVGVSEIVFIRPPDPGTPIVHHFEWQAPAPGGHVLTARAVSTGEQRLVSPPVHIKVEESGNLPPKIAIVRPEDGAHFPPLTPIDITVETVDPDGYVRRVEFFVDGAKIGERIMEFIQPPPPGQPQHFGFTWRNPTPGSHILTARATDNQGANGGADPIGITVTMPEVTPIVVVVARDPFAVEPQPDGVLNSALFQVRRYGPTNANLTVQLSLRGSAENGVDYQTIPHHVTIPAGQRQAPIRVLPLADHLEEGLETVVVRLEESALTDANTGTTTAAYRIGIPARAVALISDHPWVHHPGGAQCVPVRDGYLHICFAADAGLACRVEASRDFRYWETVCETAAEEDGSVHFVEEEGNQFPQRFYRLAPVEGTTTNP